MARGAHVLLGQLPAVLGLVAHHDAEQVLGLAGRVTTLGDELVEYGGELGESSGDPFAALGLALRRPGAVQQLVAPVHDLVVQLIRDAELMGGHRAGERDRERGHEVAFACLGDRLHPAPDVCPGPLLGGLRGAQGEALEQQLADARVQWGIDLTEEALLHRHGDAGGAHVADRGVLAVAAEHLVGVLPQRGVDDALGRANDRAFLPDLRQQAPVLGTRGVHGVEGVRVVRRARRGRVRVGHGCPSVLSGVRLIRGRPRVRPHRP